MTRIQTISTSASSGDSLRDGQRIAENLRAQGFTVSVGAEYSNVTTRHYGLISVDLTIEETETAAPAETAETAYVAPEPEAAPDLKAPMREMVAQIEEHFVNGVEGVPNPSAIPPGLLVPSSPLDDPPFTTPPKRRKAKR